jgi:Cu(I)/Ag(I) efflux system membrane fusion protein/cobalt-zinc-cadmium efflux system membrane fusion protein
MQNSWIRVLIRIIGILIILMVGISIGWFIGSGKAGGPATSTLVQTQVSEKNQWYTCGMHPNVLQKEPGNCPICGMKLVPKNQAGASVGEKESAHTIKIDPVTMQNMGIRTAKVTRGPLVMTIRTIGRVDYNERLVSFVNLKFEGWIEKLYVNQTGQYVRKGDKLFDIYSPALYSAQQEYLSALNGLKILSSGSEPIKEQARKLVEAAKMKLQFFDISDEQITALAKSGQFQKTLTIYAKAEGIVTEKDIREGAYVETGKRLYTIADLSNVWVYVDIYEYQLPLVRTGQKATMTLAYIPNKVFMGKVGYIYPYLDEQTRVTKVRLEYDNPTRELRPGMFANITLVSEINNNALLIPREAYIDTGMRKVAIVYMGSGKFEPRDINVGVETDAGTVEVTAGLKEGEVVVTSGQFLIDAESKLKEAFAKMAETGVGPASPHAGHNMPAPSATEKREVPSTQEDVKGDFTCPMHQEVQSNKPGSCPKCGMNLVRRNSIVTPDDASAHIRNQVDYLMEHYLAIQKNLAEDKTDAVALNARGLITASEEIVKHFGHTESGLNVQAEKAVQKINETAKKLNGKDIKSDRASFGDLSTATQTLIGQIRPDSKRWPKLYVMYCSMADKHWIQASPKVVNPYYGSQMLECGEIVETK